MHASKLLAVITGIAYALAKPLEEKRSSIKVIDSCTVNGTVALTFDDGPYKYEKNVTEALDGGKATFFFNGDNYDCIYDKASVVKSLYADGHIIGSHTWSHQDLTTLDESDINEELSKLEDAFVKILGVKPLYFRPPYGNTNDLVLSVLKERGYKKVFLWSDDTEDADGATSSYSEKQLKKVIEDYPNPHLVLDHSTIKTTSTKVLPYAVPKLKAAGYSLVTVDTCLGADDDNPYEDVGSAGTKDSTWVC